jgi:hypothetical protein
VEREGGKGNITANNHARGRSSEGVNACVELEKARGSPAYSTVYENALRGDRNVIGVLGGRLGEGRIGGICKRKGTTLHRITGLRLNDAIVVHTHFLDGIGHFIFFLDILIGTISIFFSLLLAEHHFN